MSKCQCNGTQWIRIQESNGKGTFGVIKLVPCKCQIKKAYKDKIKEAQKDTTNIIQAQRLLIQKDNDEYK